ncbi:hypothetical protein [Paenibacillus sp. HJGM_3]|uniref:hypothetical protein n=1 Tax=Paenibacillus sp. HJGM_3 TaxID=3379816 RepID=UPI00385F3484
MAQAVRNIEPVKLAAMECAASCVVTALRMAGKNEAYFLLDYWNLNYISRSLVSSKSVRLNALEYMYGIRTEFCRLSPEKLQSLLRGGHMVLFVCLASGFDYFPANMLTHEASGFEHVILLYAAGRTPNTFAMTDPIADYIGDVTAEQLYAASVKKDELYCYVLTFPEPGTFREPSPKAVFAHIAERNWSQYVKMNIQGGKTALERFRVDLEASLQWETNARDRWIAQNNVTISSIVKTRSLFRQSVRELGLLPEGQLAAGEQRMERIIKLWTTVNFQLVKFKRNVQDEALVASLLHKLEQLAEEELGFLSFLRGIGRDFDAI